MTAEEYAAGQASSAEADADSGQIFAESVV